MCDEKSQCISVTNELKAILEVLHIKLGYLPKDLCNDLRKCAEIMIATGATKADSSNLLLACTKKLLEETAEIDLSLNLQLINNDLKQLQSRSKLLSKQFKNDIEHHKNIGRIPTIADTNVNEISSGYHSMMNLNSSENYQNLHKKVLLLRKEINNKKQILKKLQSDVAEFEGLPPNIVAARNIFAEATEELEVMNSELEQNSFLNSSTSSFSFSP